MAASTQRSMMMLAAALGFFLVLPGRVEAQEDSPSGPTFPDTAWDCSGWHTVVSGDSCYIIQQEYDLTASEFLDWNPSVSADCITNFWPGNSYCVRVGAPGPTMEGIAANCNKWHTVGDGDGCWSIQQEYSITAEQFLDWNPAVSADCGTNFWLAYSYCVGINESAQPSEPSSTADSTTARSSTATTIIISSDTPTTTTPYSTNHPVTSYNLTAPYTATAIPPQHTPAGQPGNCNRWHWVAAGDSCREILNRYGNTLTEAQFHEYNPTLGEDCGGLYFGWYVCIGVQPTTSVSIGWSTSQTGNASIPEPTDFTQPPATFVQNFTAQPQQTGIPGSCQNFYQAVDGDTCTKVLGIYNYITQDQFFAWNPALSGNCQGLLLGFYYCVANFASTDVLMPPTVTEAPSPTGTGTTGDCTAWYLAVGNDNCASIALSFGTFSESDFITWNPNVRGDCSNIMQGTYYCIAVPDTPTTRTAPLPTTPSSAEPTQSGLAADCTKLWLVSRADTCGSIIAAAGIASADFHAWNPALGGTSCTGLQPDWYVCVSTAPVVAPTETVTLPGDGSGGDPSTTPAPGTTTAGEGEPTTTTTVGGSEPVTTPSPFMPGMVDGCLRFYFRGPDVADLYCYDIAAAAGIALEDFYTWNPQVGNDCSGLWADTWYCIGVSGPRTTISSGMPTPAAATA